MAGSASLPAPAPQLPPGLQRPGAPPPGRAEGGESAALREAAEQFEALFIESMLKAMRETVPEGGLLEGENEDVYRDILDIVAAHGNFEDVLIGFVGAPGRL